MTARPIVILDTTGPTLDVPQGTDTYLCETDLKIDGSLEVTGKVVSTANGDIDIEPNGTGNVLLGNFAFNADATIGAGQDNYVITYDHATGLFNPEALPAGSGDFKADGSVDMTGEFRTDVGTFDSDVANGASAVAFSYDTAVAYSTAGAKLVNWKNAGTEKGYIDKDGGQYWNFGSARNTLQVTTDGSDPVIQGDAASGIWLRIRNTGANGRVVLSAGNAVHSYAPTISLAASEDAANGIAFAGNSGTFTFGRDPGGVDAGVHWVIGVATSLANRRAHNISLVAGAANATSTTAGKIAGAHVSVTGGAGASSSAGDADGGHVYLDGGQGYGTGDHGDVIIGNTRGNLLLNNDYTVATLPTGIVGMIVRVTDGDASLAWGATVINSGAGATPYLCWYNGSAFTIIGK